jgi:hypothetical protein
MPIKGKGIFVAPFQGCFNVFVGTFAAVGIGLKGECGPSFDTNLSVIGKLVVHSTKLIHHTTLSRKIFGSNFSTGQVNAIVERIHFGSTHVNGMNEFMHHTLVSMGFISDVLLTDKNFWF